MSSKHVAVVATLCLALVGPAMAREDSHPPEPTPETRSLLELSLEELLDVQLVTGTRFAGRAAADAPVPITSLSGSDLRSQGSADMNEILRSLLPSFNVLAQPISDGASFVRSFNLRGLPPDQALVLVNGKRRHRGALVQQIGGPLAQGAQGPDIANFPAIALQRVEVLRDGSAAQYGSDAIAGVINFILRDDDGSEWRLQQGVTREGDGNLTHLGGYHGGSFGRSGRFAISTEWYERGEISRGFQRPDAAFYATQGLAVADPAMVWGAPSADSLRSVWRGAWQEDGREWYGFGGFSRSRGDGSFFYRNLQRDFFVNNIDVAGAQLLPCPALPDDPFGFLQAQACLAAADADSGLFNFLQRFPAGFTPRFSASVEDSSQVLGLRGALGAGRFDLSAGFGQHRIEYAIRDTINPSLGPDSPTAFRPGNLQQREIGINLDLSWPLGRHQLAAGLEWRMERYRIEAGDEDSWRIGPWPTLGIGSNGFPGFDPSQAGEFGRHNASVYLDSEWRPGDDWLLAAAVRHERYSDFGNTTKGKLALRYAATPRLSLRAAWSTGFRAPTLGQSHSTNVRTLVLGAGVPLAVGLVPPGSDIAAFFGAGPLQPETSVNRNLGLVWRDGDLTVSLDAYRIDVAERIALSSEIDITPELREQLLAAGLSRALDFAQIQFFANTFDTRTRGLDLVAERSFSHRHGATVLQFGLSRVLTDVIRVGGAGVISPERRFSLERLLPRTRASIGLRQQRRVWNWQLRGNYYGRWSYADEGQFEHFGSVFMLDLEGTRAFGRHWSLAIGASNAFDRYPGRSAILLNVGQPYVQFNPLRALGASYYARIEFRF